MGLYTCTMKYVVAISNVTIVVYIFQTYRATLNHLYNMRKYPKNQ